MVGVFRWRSYRNRNIGTINIIKWWRVTTNNNNRQSLTYIFSYFFFFFLLSFRYICHDFFLSFFFICSFVVPSLAFFIRVTFARLMICKAHKIVSNRTTNRKLSRIKTEKASVDCNKRNGCAFISCGDIHALFVIAVRAK